MSWENRDRIYWRAAILIPLWLGISWSEAAWPVGCRSGMLWSVGLRVGRLTSRFWRMGSRVSLADIQLVSLVSSMLFVFLFFFSLTFFLPVRSPLR